MSDDLKNFYATQYAELQAQREKLRTILHERQAAGYPDNAGLDMSLRHVERQIDEIAHRNGWEEAAGYYLPWWAYVAALCAIVGSAVWTINWLFP